MHYAFKNDVVWLVIRHTQISYMMIFVVEVVLVLTISLPLLITYCEPTTLQSSLQTLTQGLYIEML